MCWVVEPKTLANSIGKDGTEQPDTTTGNTTPTRNDRQTAWLGLLPGGRLARSDIMHEAIDIVARDRSHRPPTVQVDGVARDPATVAFVLRAFTVALKLDEEFAVGGRLPPADCGLGNACAA